MTSPPERPAATPVGLHHGEVDDEATTLVLETLFDIRAVAYEIRDDLLGDDDEEEEEDT